MIYNDLTEIYDNFDHFLFDAYGVFAFGSKETSLSVVKLMENIIKNEKTLTIISNSSASAYELEIGYKKRGLVKGIHYNEILSSGEMVLNDIKNDTLPFIGKKYYLAYYQGLKEPVPYVFKDSCYELVTDINKADFVYCGVPQTENKERSDLNLLMPEIERIKKSELPLICPNPDYMAVEGDKFVICQGLVSKTYEDMGGKVVYYGKPNADIFLKALENLKISNKSKALMVGDTIRTDIKGANNANIAACLTLSKSVTENEMVSKNIEVNEKNIFEYAKNWDAVPDFIIKKVSKEELF